MARGDVVRMPIVPVWDRDRSRAPASNHVHGVAKMIGRRFDPAVGPSQVLARSGAEYAGSGVSLRPTLFNGSVAGELAFGEIAKHHVAAFGRMPRDGRAETDFDVI